MREVPFHTNLDGGQVHLVAEPTTIRTASVARVGGELEGLLAKTITTNRVLPHVLRETHGNVCNVRTDTWAEKRAVLAAHAPYLHDASQPLMEIL